MPPEVSYAWGFYSFAEEGKQKLVDYVQKPIAFVQIRTVGSRSGCWDLSSKEIVTSTPSALFYSW